MNLQAFEKADYFCIRQVGPLKVGKVPCPRQDISLAEVTEVFT
jgi:hypothetical protein